MKNFIKIPALIILSLSLINSSFAQNADYDTSSIDNPCVILQNNLRLRSKDSNTGGDVSELQSFLQDRGFLSSEPTGYFGGLTGTAVKNYQVSKGMSPTAFVGPLTRAKIQADTCNNPLPPTPQPTPQPQVCTMEMRFCADGSAMPRDSNCTWRSDRCAALTINYCTPGIINSTTNFNFSINSRCTCPTGTIEEAYISPNPTGVYQFICRANNIPATNFCTADITNQSSNYPGATTCICPTNTVYTFISSYIGGNSFICRSNNIIIPTVNICPININLTDYSCECPSGYSKTINNPSSSSWYYNYVNNYTCSPINNNWNTGWNTNWNTGRSW